MSETGLETPVALMIFNRPQTTAQVFERVRRARPRRLLIAADGPRAGNPDDEHGCAAAREIVSDVDWPCEVTTEFSSSNLGCRTRLSSGLDWVFGLVDSAIVLEDDCLPHPSFFSYCEQLLDHYADEDRVMHVSGDNFSSIGRRGPRWRLSRPSYYFSRYPHVWGWASWRRAWAAYDVDMRTWRDPATRDRVLAGFEDPGERDFWETTWGDTAAGRVDTWDYQWVFACIERGGLSAMPRRNLVSNIGFGEGARHTVGKSPLADLPTAEIESPLRHPGEIARDRRADAHSASLFFGASG